MINRIHDGWILTPDRQSGRGEAACLRYKTACAWFGESIGAGCVFSRFSWLLESDRRGEACAAYRVWVSLSAEGLSNRDEDLVWDSGRRSGQSLSLLYDGPPLQSNTRYWWRVTVWDRQGKESESIPAYWDTGLFPGDWSAEWIWRSEEMRLNDFAYFRKSFDLRGAVARAKIFVSAHHVFQLSVNGQRVGGYGSPAPTGCLTANIIWLMMWPPSCRPVPTASALPLIIWAEAARTT